MGIHKEETIGKHAAQAINLRGVSVCHGGYGSTAKAGVFSVGVIRQ